MLDSDSSAGRIPVREIPQCELVLFGSGDECRSAKETTPSIQWHPLEPTGSPIRGYGSGAVWIHALLFRIRS